MLPQARQGYDYPEATSADGLEEEEAARRMAPTHLPTCKYVLHLSSSRRRPGDLQDWIEQQQDFNCVVLQVDVDAEAGDLTYWYNTLKFARMIAQGHILGVLAEPPSETWRGTKHQHAGHEGPPP
eukprot:2820913-Pyramimonas_sp.AAC.1